MATVGKTSLYYRMWRWHFIAGLVVLPFAILLALTGGVYLFKSEVEASIEASINSKSVNHDAAVERTADEIVAAAQAKYKSGRFRVLTLPSSKADQTYEVELEVDQARRVLFIDRSSGEILHDTLKSARVMNVTKNIHGTLLAGNNGSYVVEFMASWMIILILTGVFLHWPRSKPVWRWFIPQIVRLRPREVWKSIHVTVGAWIGVVILVFLLSGLPWTQLWGDGFDRVSKFAGWDGPGQEWFVTLQSEHADHSGHSMPKVDGLNLWERASGDEGEVSLKSSANESARNAISLQSIIRRVEDYKLKHPIEIQPPKGENGVWTVRSMTQYRPDRETVHFDKWNGTEIMHIRFSDYHAVKQITSYGIAFHEGALFGTANQIVGVLAAVGVILLSVTGLLMWWKRRPNGRLGIPPMPSEKRLVSGVILLIVGLSVFLPMVALTLLCVLTFELLAAVCRRLQESS